MNSSSGLFLLQDLLLNGANETTFSTETLQYTIKRMKKEDVPEFGTYVVSVYAEMVHVSIDGGFYEEELNWGVIGRSVVKEYPEIAKMAIDVIVYALERLKGKTDEKSKSWYYLARSDLDGLKAWENHDHDSIVKRIDTELAKFPAIT